MAVEREAKGRSLGLSDLRSYEGGLSPDHFGAFGEAAVAHALGLYVPHHMDANGKDGGIDITVGGVTLAVKTTRAPGHNFLIPEHQKFVADYGVLVWPTGAEAAWIIAGWCSTAEVGRAKRPFPNAPRPCYIVPRSALQQWPIPALETARA